MLCIWEKRRIRKIWPSGMQLRCIYMSSAQLITLPEYLFWLWASIGRTHFEMKATARSARSSKNLTFSESWKWAFPICAFPAKVWKRTELSDPFLHPERRSESRERSCHEGSPSDPSRCCIDRIFFMTEGYQKRINLYLQWRYCICTEWLKWRLQLAFGNICLSPFQAHIRKKFDWN